MQLSFSGFFWTWTQIFQFQKFQLQNCPLLIYETGVVLDLCSPKITHTALISVLGTHEIQLHLHICTTLRENPKEKIRRFVRLKCGRNDDKSAAGFGQICPQKDVFGLDVIWRFDAGIRLQMVNATNSIRLDFHDVKSDG